MKLLNLNVCMKLDNTEGVVHLIKRENPELCTLQEVMHAMEESCFPMYKSKNELVRLDEYPFVVFAPLYVAKAVTKNGEVTRDFGGKAEQGSLLLSKYKLLSHKNEFYYNEYRYEYDATEFREKDWCRSIQNVILNVDGRKLQIINVHGIWNKDKLGDERTIAQSEFILSRIREDIPVLVVGDFNLLPNTESIKMLNEKMTNLIEKFGVTSTRPKFDDGLDKGEFVCDYIFVNDKVKVNDFKVLEDEVSDHLPFILDFDI